MPTFQYKAKKDSAGTADAVDTVLGQIVAENKEDAVDKINQLGLVAVSVEEGGLSASGRSFTARAQVKSKELYLFSRQLVHLLKSGVSVLRALEVISGQLKNAYFKNMIQSMCSSIRNGSSFSDCLAEYPHVFSSLYVTMMRAGEESGQLRKAVSDMAQYQRQQEEIASKVRTALAYPIVMAVFGIGTVFFILTFVLPQITELFDSLDKSLPGPTIFVMRLSNFLIDGFIWISLFVIIAGVSIRKWGKSRAGQILKSRMMLGLPFVREFFLKIELARFCSTLELLVKSGISVVRAIQLSIPVITNDLVREQLSHCHAQLLDGKSFGESLKQADLIPPMMGYFIAVGEESGALGETFHDITESYEQETDETIKIMMTLLEPLMIMVVGSVVGFILVAMLLPIFQLDVFVQ